MLAIIGTGFLLPLFNRLTDKQILLSQSLDAGLLFYFALLLVVIILLAGLYPAKVLSNLKPAEVLYNKQRFPVDGHPGLLPANGLCAHKGSGI